MIFAVPVILSWLAAGCAAPGASARDATVRRFENTDRVSVLDAAILALGEYGYAIDPRAARDGVLRTYPLDMMVGTGALRRRRARRSVSTTHVQQSEGLVTAYCRVEIQERSTEARRLWAHEHDLSDLPIDTPIDREGATTQEQNTVWRTVGRDKAKERSILDIISQIISEAVTLPGADPARRPK